MQGLFSESDLDQDMIEIERRKMAREKEAKKKEAEVKEEKNEEKLPFDKRVYILDGYAIIYRTYFAHISSPIKDGNGVNISGYFGFFTTLFSLLSHYKMDYLAVTMDERVPTFRHEMYSEYKAGRDKTPEDLHAQVPLIRETLKKMNIPVISKPRFEADDIIASLVKKAESIGLESVMITGDKDLCQLVNDHVFALRPPKKGEKEYKLLGKEGVKEEYGVYPDQILDLLSLTGDAADNVPGVAGVGPVTAIKLLEQYLTLDGIYRHLDGIKGAVRTKLEKGKDNAYFSKKLITLSEEALDDDFDFSALDMETSNLNGAAEDFERYNCRSLLRRVGGVKKSDDSAVSEEKKEEAKPSLLTDAETKAYVGPGVYITLASAEDVRKRFKEIADFSGGVMTLDFFTDGYEENSPILGFAFSDSAKKGYYVDFSDDGIKREEATEIFDEFLRSKKIRIVNQNVKYDLKCLWRLGSDAEYIFDTMVAAWLLDSNINSYSLEDLSLQYLNHTMLNYKDVLDKGQTLSDMSLSLRTRIAGANADIAFRMYRILERRLYERSLNSVFAEFELPLIRTLASMEREGIHLSKEKMIELEEKIGARINDLENAIYTLAGHEFNINSTMQLSAVLFEEKGLEASKKTQRGYSTDTATLEGLKGSDPIIDYLLEYRQLSKLKSTYVDTLPTLCDENSKIHTSFLQTGTATGRLSSRNPNLQNIPVRTDEGRLIRAAFTSTPGTVFLSADYSQIELVVLAHMTGDPNLVAAFKAGEDVHKYTASLIFNKSVDEVTPSERRIAKTINFGIMYGMSAFRLAGDLGVSRSEAQNFITRYFERYKEVRRFIDETNESARKNGYIKTRSGHIREVIGINSSNKVEKAAAERVAVNSVIQGTAAEIMKKAMNSVYNEINKRGLKSRMILQVHDELIFEVPYEELDEMKRLVKTTMETIDTLSVPLKASVESAECWGDMH